MRALYFNFSGYSGFDVILTLFPKSFQTRHVARVWLHFLEKTTGRRPNISETPLIIQMPWASYRIMDHNGDVEKVPTENFKIPV